MTSAAIQKAAADMQASQRALEAQITQAGVQAQGWSHDVVMTLSIGVMLLTALALSAATLVLARKQNVAGAAEIVKVFGVILVIALSSMLVVVGYSSEQLTPIIGLFGAIAGYLVGKDTKP